MATTRGIVTGVRLHALPGQVPGGGPLPEGRRAAELGDLLRLNALLRQLRPATEGPPAA
jgi:hypothetical protein